MRKRVFGIIELSRDGDRLGGLYDAFMMAVILLSMVPLSFKESNGGFVLIERAAAAIFILDYLLRLWTADLKLGKGWRSFLLYPFTPMALVDLLAVLPTFFAVAAGLRLAKLLRLFRTFRVFRSFKMFRYSRSFEIIAGVIRDQRGPLLAVGTLAVGYVLVSALVIFNVEPDTFGTFFDAVYWATVSLTTMGYGDIYPVTTVGRMVTMLSAFVGIAIVALPSGIITAGYMDRLRDGR
ncbi:MAG: ion transporter [Lachnospiraceae bacterium]|nr:ion transporter [Lachnospiraceae bacterium]